MPKRIKAKDFASLMIRNGLGGKELKKPAIQSFAAEQDVSVPVAFWQEYKGSKRGYYLAGETSIKSEEKVNEDLGDLIPDDEFECVVTHSDGSLIMLVEITDKVSGEKMSTTVTPTAEQKTIDNILRHYKKKLRHL